MKPAALLPSLYLEDLANVQEQKPAKAFQGNVRGVRFWSALTYKRVRGKFKVRGPSKITPEELTNGIYPDRWQEIKQQEKNKANEIKTQTSGQ